MPRYIRVFQSNADPSQDKARNEYYEKFHGPDVIEFGCLRIVRGFNPDPGPGQGRFAVIYEFETNDIANFDKEIAAFNAKKAAEGRKNLATSTGREIRVPSAEFRKISEHTYNTYDLSRPKAQRYIKLFQADCDPSQDAALNKWYEEIHAPDALEFGCLSVIRGFNPNPGPEQGRFLVMYEMETNDLAKFTKDIEAFNAKKNAQGHRNPVALSIKASAEFKKIYERTYETYDYARPRVLTR